MRRGNFKPLVRAMTVMGMVMVVVSGVTFAALQSQQAVLAGNTIETASADLRISTDGSSYYSSRQGFDFPNIIPGAVVGALPTSGYSYYLKNFGGTPSQIKASVSSVPTNPNNVDLSKVNIIFTRVSGGTAQSISLASLMSSYASGGTALTDILPAGSQYQYKIQVSMAADAFTGSSASLGNIDIVFTGVAVAS
jgi:hypothetical protein